MYKKELPNKPSKLIRIALEDLEKVENTPGLVVSMFRWISNDFGAPNCRVCLAGSVMLKTLRVRKPPRGKEKTPSSLGLIDRTMEKLYALNDWRIGDVKEGLERLNIKKPKRMRISRSITPYDVNSVRFKKDLRKLADDFERSGL